MQDLVLKVLGERHGTPIQLMWFGNVRSNVGTSHPRALVGVTVRPLGTQGPVIDHDVFVPAGYLRFVRLGDIWCNGRLTGSAPLAREVFSSLMIDDSTTTLGPAGSPLQLPAGQWYYDLDFQKFDAHRRHTGSWVARIVVDETTTIVIPCAELMRFYFGASGSLAAQLLSGARSSGGLYVDWHYSVATGTANITLGKDLNGAAATTVARIAADKTARRAFWAVAKSGVADLANRKPWYPRMSFPLVGKTDLTCEGVWLDHGDRKVFVVHRLIQCTHPFPFSKLYYRLSSDGTSPATTVSKRSGDQSAQETAVAGDSGATAILAAQGTRDEHLRPVEAVSRADDVEPFPDLAFKAVIRVNSQRSIPSPPRQSEESIGEPAMYAPMGSTDGDLRSMDIGTGQAEMVEREPKLLTQLTLEVITAIGVGGRIRSPLGGSAPLRLSVVDELSDADEAVWLFLACRTSQTARTSNETQVIVSFKDSYFDGPGFEVSAFKVGPGKVWSPEACDQIANFSLPDVDSLDPLPDVSYVEGCASDSTEGSESLLSLARSISSHLLSPDMPFARDK